MIHKINEVYRKKIISNLVEKWKTEDHGNISKEVLAVCLENQSISDEISKENNLDKVLPFLQKLACFWIAETVGMINTIQNITINDKILPLSVRIFNATEIIDYSNPLLFDMRNSYKAKSLEEQLVLTLDMLIIRESSKNFFSNKVDLESLKKEIEKFDYIISSEESIDKITNSLSRKQVSQNLVYCGKLHKKDLFLCNFLKPNTVLLGNRKGCLFGIFNCFMPGKFPCSAVDNYFANLVSNYSNLSI